MTDIKTRKAYNFLKWCNKRCNHPAPVQLAKEIIIEQQARIAELEAEVKLLRGCNESSSVSPTITAGCYCTDIETEAQYVATCEALVKLGCLASGFYSYPDSGMCSYRDEYLINGNVGWVEPSMEISNGIYHAKGDLRHCFTTLVSHRDIIKAAEGL
mgnify:FL=1